MQGVAAGLAAVADRSDIAFVCSTDMPFLHPAFVRRVLRGLNDTKADMLPPLSLIHIQELITKLIGEGDLRPGMLVKHCEVAQLDDAQLLDDSALKRLDPDLESVLNINTPEDYAAARNRPSPTVTVERFGALAGKDGHRPVDIQAATLGEAAGQAGLELNRHVVAAVNGDQVTRDAKLPLVAGDSVAFLSADAGG